MARFAASTLVALTVLASAAHAETAPSGAPDASLDLGTAAGVAAMKTAWRYSDARITEVDFRSVGADLKPSGPPNRTWDVEPHAGAADFDDSGWEIIDPTTLAGRRSTGKVCFNWYRLALTVPSRVGDLDLAGSTAVLDVVVDDYAEIWVDGKLPRELGQRGGSVAAGWNAPNRLVVGRDLVPGQKIQLAIFGINGPISAAPENYIWIRSARLDFYRPMRDALAFGSTPLEVIRKDPAIDKIVPPGTMIEKLADGFVFTEGPVWSPDGNLFFSDPNTNVIYRWSPQRQVSVFRERSGYGLPDFGRLRQPGSNGLAFDAQGRLTVCEHGNRRVSRIEPDGKVTVLADRYEGKRLNSPNDLVYRSDGALYFTDPPFGLPKFHDDPERDLDFTGVFCLKDGQLRVVSKDLKGPNGLAFSPDEKYLYVSNWDEQNKIIMRYDVRRDGSLGNGKRFFSMDGAPGEEALDGLKVDSRGNIYATGPVGLWVIAPSGKHLGTLIGPELPANAAWGDADGRTLYLAARSGLYRVRLAIPGVRPLAMAQR